MFVIIYFLIYKIKDLRVIPFSLLVILFLSVSGPWNVFRIAKKNQFNRLIKIAQFENIYVNGKIQAKNTIVKQSTETEISNIVHYLVTTHGHKSIINLFPINVDSLFNDEINIHSNLEKTLNSAGLDYNLYNNNEDDYQYKVFKTENNEFIFPIEDARYFCILELHSDTNSEEKISYLPTDSLYFNLSLNPKMGFIKIFVNNIEDAILWLGPYYSYLNNLQKTNTNLNNIYVDQNNFKAIAKGKFFDYTFYFKDIEFILSSKYKYPRPTSVKGYVFIGPILKKHEGSNKSI